jgi:hypothetical protein
MAEIGTPENPEIIEPGGGQKSSRPQAALSRWPIARQIFRILVAVSLPAIGLDMICAWLFHTAVNYGGALPVIGLVVLTIPALIFTLIAVAANLILWPALILILSGKATQNPLNDPRFARFRVINVRR